MWSVYLCVSMSGIYERLLLCHEKYISDIGILTVYWSLPYLLQHTVVWTEEEGWCWAGQSVYSILCWESTHEAAAHVSLPDSEWQLESQNVAAIHWSVSLLTVK